MTSDLAQAVLCDIDGTLAIRVGRGPYNWREAHSDHPNPPVVTAIRALHAAGLQIIYLSGRPESARLLTEQWIAREVGTPGPLFMRDEKDFRRDSEIKRDIYLSHIQPRYVVTAIFDDRNQVVRMWRDELGLTCFQVADGDF